MHTAAHAEKLPGTRMGTGGAPRGRQRLFLNPHPQAPRSSPSKRGPFSFSPRYLSLPSCAATHMSPEKLYARCLGRVAKGRIAGVPGPRTATRHIQELVT